jgi:hypothetical protein
LGEGHRRSPRAVATANLVSREDVDLRPQEHTKVGSLFTLKFNAEDIPALADRYGPEQDDRALAAGSRIRGGECTRKNLSEIFEWKTRGRGRSRLLRNSDDEISDALRLAIAAQTERAAIVVLTGLAGVDVPVASAIMTAIDPERYTVIDFRALQSLGIETANRSLNLYLAYLRACRRIADDNGVTLRNLDRALWQWSSEQSAP